MKPHRESIPTWTLVPRTVDTILSEAVEIESAAEREAYLDEACGKDAELSASSGGVDCRLISGPESFFGGSSLACAATIDFPPITERPGTQIGPYKLIQEIGDGGMGMVFMAQQKEPVRRKVALKIIKPGMDTREVIARFEAEEQALAMMDHPNIAKVLRRRHHRDGQTVLRDGTGKWSTDHGVL